MSDQLYDEDDVEGPFMRGMTFVGREDGSGVEGRAKTNAARDSSPLASRSSLGTAPDRQRRGAGIKPGLPSSVPTDPAFEAVREAIFRCPISAALLSALRMAAAVQVPTDQVYEMAKASHAQVNGQAQDVVSWASCSKCHQPIRGDLVPAVDIFTNLPTCDDCSRAQRHLHRRNA